MNNVVALTQRNLKLYFRDVGSMILSLLSALILLGLFVLFLGQLQVDAISNQMPTADTTDIERFISSWVLSGMIMVSTLSTALGALGSYVDDRSSGRFKEFLVTPIKRHELTLGYQLSAFLVAALMGTLILVIGTVALGSYFGSFPSWQDLLIAEGYTLLLAFAYSAIAAFILTFIKSQSGYTGVSVTVGTLIGFIAGVYLPIGSLNASIGNVLNALPFSPGAMLLREPLAGDALDRITDGNDAVAAALGETYGFDLYIGDWLMESWFAAVYIAAVAITFTALSSLRIGRTIR